MPFDGGAIVGTLDLSIRGWEKSVDKVKRDQQSLSGLVMRHEKQFQSMGRTISVVGGAVTATLGAIVKKTADTGDAINDLSQRTGIGTEILSGYKLAFDKSGTSQEGFGVGMRNLSRIMDEAWRGGKESQAVFKRLSVEYKDSEGKLRPLNDVMLDAAERFSQMDAGARKSALAQDVFGKSGAELIPMLNMGKKGLQENFDITEKLGGLWSKEAASSADQFNDSLAELKASGGGLTKEIGMALMPTVKDMIGSVTNTIAKVREWAAEHPGLTRGIAETVGKVGLWAVALGPVLIALPKIIKGVTELKMLFKHPLLLTISIGLPVFTKAVSDFKKSFKDAMDYVELEGAKVGGFEKFMISLNAAVTKVTTGYDMNRVAGAKMDSMQKEAYKSGYALSGVVDWLTKNLKAAKKPGDDLGDSIESLAEKLDLALRPDLEKRFEDLLLALAKYKGQLTAEGEKKLLADLIALRGELDNTKPSIVSVEETLAALMKTIADSVSEGDVASMGQEWSDTAAEMQREFEASTQGIVDNILSTQVPLGLLNTWIKMVADQAGVSAQTVVRDFYEMQRQLLATLGILIPAWPELGDAAAAAGQKAKSVWQEVSTVVADAVRDIARSVMDVFDLHKFLLGEAKEFDNSYFEGMVAQADKVYEEMRKLIEGQVSALKEATDKEIELVKDKYKEMESASEAAFDAMKKASDRAHDDMLDAAKKTFDANELLLTRAQQDSDRRRSRVERVEDRRYADEYERQRKAIENSSKTEEQKQAALEALKKAYDDAADAREDAREEARIARERRREDAKLARQAQYDAVKQIRERHYEDVQRIWAVNQEKRLEKIRADGRAAEQALRDAAALKEQEFLTNLLNLQQQHETDKDNLRAAEKLARDRHAQDEEDRQNSLWAKIKGIIATTVEGIGTILLTRLLAPIVDKIIPAVGSMGDKAEEVLGAGGLGKTVGAAAKGIGSIFTGLATTIGTVLTTLGTAIGTVITTLATAVATAAHILVGALPDLMLLAAAALAIYAGFTIVKGIVDKILGGGGKSTDVTFWLKPISERAQEIRDWLFINCQEKLDFFSQALVDIGTWTRDIIGILLNIGEWTLGIKDDKFNAQLDKMDWIGRMVSRIAIAAESLVKSSKAALTNALSSGFAAANGPFAWTLSGAGGGGQIPFRPGEINMPFTPGPNVPIPGKPYIPHGWDAPGGGRWGRWGPLTAGEGGTGGFGGSAWKWLKGQDSDTKRLIDGWLKENFGKNDEAMRLGRELLSKGLYDEFLRLIMGLEGKIKMTPFAPPDINGPILRGAPLTPRDLAGGGGEQKNTFIFNINALDGADVEAITKKKIIPYLKRFMKSQGNPAADIVFRGI